VHTGDYFIDLGSGDGRIVIEAAKRGAAASASISIGARQARDAQRPEAGWPIARCFEVKDIFATDLSARA